MKTYPCFGLESLGQCNYDPTDPTVYFSIGQLIPLLIITIAVYQFLNPIVKLRIKSNRLFRPFGLKDWINKVQFPGPFQPLILLARFFISFIEKELFYYLVLISIFSVFLSSVIPSIPNSHEVPIVGYPVFWEIVAGLILAYLGVYFSRIIIKPAKLNKHNYKEFFNCSLCIIDRREEKELISLARELIPSLDTIMSIGKDYDSFYSQLQGLARKKYAPHTVSISLYEINQFIKKDKDLQKMIQSKEIEWFCLKIMDLLSDTDFCRICACKVPEFFERFFLIAVSNNCIFIEQKKIFRSIMRSSFEEEHSILNRENQYHGLGGISYLTNTIFENEELFSKASFTSLTSSWIGQVKFIKEWQIKLYFNCLRVALKSSFNIEDDQTLENIYDGYLNNQRILNNIHKLPFEQKLKLFNRVSFEIQQGLYIVNENEDKIKKYNSKDPFLFPGSFRSNRQGSYEVSLYDILAKSIFNFFLHLSTIDIKNINEQFSVRNMGTYLFIHLLADNEKESNKQISKILASYIKFHITEMDFKEQGYYTLTQYMISLIGLYYPKEKKSELDAFKIWFLNKLKKDFHSLYITDKQFALKLLPFDTSYDSSKKILTQTHRLRFVKDIFLQCE